MLNAPRKLGDVFLYFVKVQSKWISNLSSVSLLNSILLTVLELRDKSMLDLAAVMTVIPMKIFLV